MPSSVYDAVVTTAAACLICGCSWARFDEVKEDSPVASLEAPGGMKDGFGNRLASASLDGEVRLFVTGAPGEQGGASYNLGRYDHPSLEASDASHCTGQGDTCFLAAQPVALPRGPDQGEELDVCLVSGLGIRRDSSGGTTGLITRCETAGSDVQFAYPLPEGTVADRANELLGKDIGDPLLFGADLSELPLLVAVWPQERHAWYYLPGDDNPVAIELPPGLDDDTPTSVGVLRNGSGWLLAIGASNEGHVWLLRIADDGTTSTIGCLGGLEGLGRALAAGPVVAQDHDDLAVSDSVNVHVFAGASLATLPATEDPSCSLAALPTDSLIASFGCGQSPSVQGCDDADFGAAIAIGDVDGDGDGEVAVGAPRMTVRGENAAGAVLLYDVEGSDSHELVEVKFISSAENGDHLGESLAMPRIEGRHVIAAGGPGGGKAVIFYCNELLPSSLAGPRCD